MSYPTDLLDKDWDIIRPFLEYQNGYGHRRKYDVRNVINAIFYVSKQVVNGGFCHQIFQIGTRFIPILID